eukprot:TRINITY_DN5327_c0_g1_i1.p1 TRINITY_DN5327_c0_g1~~TRINITY_DN5327_c0_g1_i1.p1  ORF type:complete len:616 (+),score=76.75 TRINITY_DN5327_c0_g1_i1:249-1850(+)
MQETANAAGTELRKILAFTTHLSLPAVLLPTPYVGLPLIAHHINDMIQCNRLFLWVRIPLLLHNSGDNDAAWNLWNRLRYLCNFHGNLFPALELTEDLPTETSLFRWKAEVVKAIIIPTKIFITDVHGTPLLSSAHQKFVRQCISHKAQIIITGECESWKPYFDHIKSVHKSIPEPTPQQQYESPYYDYLQAPLQPLMDNLESQTYEVFEGDPVKYVQYEAAVYQCLVERHRGKATKDVPVCICVVGAGRGPLVKASLRAAAHAKVPVRIYAVEKNPNAIPILQSLKAQCNWGNVTLVHSDMRHWQAPEGADIMVSELLGSFGDNELSPECLDGAQRFLKAGGVSIPVSYTSFLAPLMSTKLHTDVLSYPEKERVETPYVVRIHSGVLLARPEKCLFFAHPNPELGYFDQPNPTGGGTPPVVGVDNSRYWTHTFQAEFTGLVHGLAGYFDSELYGKAFISIHPEHASDGMFSWFPLYFPIKVPVPVREGEPISVHLWRKVGSGKVWYEWAVEASVPSPIHNVNGRSHSMGLST